MSQGKYKYKHSSTDRDLNTIWLNQVIWIFCLGLLLMGFTYIFYKGTIGKKYLDLKFTKDVDTEESLAYLTGQGFVTFWLLLVRFIPMDVILNIEAIKIFGSLFMEFDTSMYLKD